MLGSIERPPELASTGDEFPEKFFFVIKDPRWRDILESGSLPDPDEMRHRFAQPQDCWVVQTYLQLARRGVPVELVSNVVPKSICILSSSELSIRDGLSSSFLVVCRHDYFRPAIANQIIVQNSFQIEGDGDHFIPHWPQPGLIEREKVRGDTVERIAFRGGGNNLAPAFKTPEFRQALASLGAEIDIGDQAIVADRAIDWWDYRDADLTIAVRNLTFVDARNKPASKLVNAWLAGCPALLGPEPAFQELRRSELDFITVRTPDDVLSIVARLKRDPALYRSMIDQGFRRAKDFTADKVAERWVKVLTGPVVDAFGTWRTRHAAIHLADFPLRAAKHHRSRATFFKSFTKGPRILG